MVMALDLLVWELCCWTWLVIISLLTLLLPLLSHIISLDICCCFCLCAECYGWLCSSKSSAEADVCCKVLKCAWTLLLKCAGAALLLLWWSCVSLAACCLLIWLLPPRFWEVAAAGYGSVDTDMVLMVRWCWELLLMRNFYSSNFNYHWCGVWCCWCWNTMALWVVYAAVVMCWLGCFGWMLCCWMLVCYWAASYLLDWLHSCFHALLCCWTDGFLYWDADILVLSCGAWSLLMLCSWNEVVFYWVFSW